MEKEYHIHQLILVHNLHLLKGMGVTSAIMKWLVSKAGERMPSVNGGVHICGAHDYNLDCGGIWEHCSL